MATFKAREIERVEAALKMLQKHIDELLPHLMRALVIVDVEESGNYYFDEYKAYFEALARIKKLADKLIGKLEPRPHKRPPDEPLNIFLKKIIGIDHKKGSQEGAFYYFVESILNAMGEPISNLRNKIYRIKAEMGITKKR